VLPGGSFLAFFSLLRLGLWSVGLSERHQGDGDKEYGRLHQDNESEFREAELSAAGSVGPQISPPEVGFPFMVTWLGFMIGIYILPETQLLLVLGSILSQYYGWVPSCARARCC
jgi:hypothetical protein